MSQDPARRQGPLPATFVKTVRRALDLQGYVVLHDVLTPDEVAAANAALDRLDLPDHGDLRPLVDRDDVFLDHIDHRKILPYVLALLGGNIQLMGSNVTVIPPGAGPMVWHEDGPRPWSYPAVDGRRPLVIVRVGIFLQDLSETDRGNLVVVPGSHQLPFHASDGDEAMGNLPNVTPVRARPGSIVLFHNGIWHSTAPNHMDVPRRVLYYAYTPCWHRVVDWVTPPESLVERVDRMEPRRRQLMRQLLGVVPEGGAPAFMFPEPEAFPGLAMVEPEHPASGA